MKKLFFPILIFIFTLIIWKPVLNQALIGEGPIYFNPPYLTMLNNNPFSVLWSRHDSQALIFFHFAKTIFKDNMQAYMWFLLAGASFVSISLFFLIKKITSSFIAASLTTILFVANFVGSYEILGLGYYQWFIQRVPNFGISLISFICLVIFFEKKKKSYYYLSFLLYVLSVYLARYTIHILPLFIFYIFFINFFGKEIVKKKILNFVLAALPFVISSYILFKAQSLVTGSSEITTFKQLVNILPNVFYQITYLTVPILKDVPRYLFKDTIKFGSIFITLLYILATYFIVKKNSKNKTLVAFIISIALSIPLSVLLSIILNPIFIPFYDSSRYLYYSSLLVASFWGVCLWVLINSYKKLLLPVIILAILLVIYNKRLLDSHFSDWQEKELPTLSVISYMKQNGDRISRDTTIIVPPQVGYYGSGMLNYFYDKNNIQFQPFTADGNPTNTKNVIYLKYIPEKNAVEKFINK